MQPTLRILTLIPLGLALTACFDGTTNSTSDKAPVYVAIGNSLTAGFQSGGLRADWQKASYPALLAQQMGVTDFQMPLVDSPGVGSSPALTGQFATPLYLDATGNPAPHFVTGNPSSLFSNQSYGHPYNDLGVPGATTRDVLMAYDHSTSQSGANTLFDAILRGPLLGNTTMLHQAISLNPDILTMWVGSNDILSGIIAGTITEGVTVTPVAIYTGMMDQIFDSLLTQTHARIFVANIPSITSIPYVTTVPRSFFDSTFHVSDTSTRLLTEKDNVKYVLLPALASLKKGDGFPTAAGGTGIKLPKNLTLTQAEADLATQLIDGYNAYLKTKVAAHPDRLALVDVNALLNKLVAGELAPLTGKFFMFDPTHTAFSYDGVHPNDKGYREVANVYLDAINSALGKHYAKLSN